MGLKHLKLRVEQVEVSDGETFTVRGLGLEDILILVQSHQANLGTLFDEVVSAGAQLTVADSSSVASMLFEVAPAAANHIIALGADEEDMELVKRLPFPVQLDALEKIGSLTFTTAGGPKKVVEAIMRVLNGATTALTSLQA